MTRMTRMTRIVPCAERTSLAGWSWCYLLRAHPRGNCAPKPARVVHKTSSARCVRSC